MAWRIQEEDVRSLIDTDSDKLIGPFIMTANALVDYVVTQDTDGILTTAMKAEIEKYLAAHFYEHLDPQYAQKKTGDASATFQGEWGKGLDGSSWGQTAQTLDLTGTLTAIKNGRKRVGLTWLGLPPSEQTDYVNRD